MQRVCLDRQGYNTIGPQFSHRGPQRFSFGPLNSRFGSQLAGP
jgi:hypothetical protein